MKLNRLTPVQNITILAPRWHDRKVLIAGFKVGTHNVITFTKAPTYPGQYYLSGETIRKYPLGTNGKIKCYEVPLDELELLESDAND